MTLRLNLFLASVSLVSFLFAQDEQMTKLTAQFQFERTEHDFGQVLQDSENSFVFKFKNSGSVPLIISNASGSCGCTVPDYANEPIQPGAESEIHVVYKPGKQEGDQVKTVTVTANTEPSETILRTHAEVLTKGRVRATEPYVFGPLPVRSETVFDPITSFDPFTSEPIVAGPNTQVLFDVYEHDFGQIPQGSENPYVFKFKNTGTEPLVIQNAAGSCGCTVPFFAKDPIMPGEESEIHVVYKPGKQEGNQSKTVTITANTEPMQTILRIKAEVLVVDSVTATSLFAIDEEHEQDREAIEGVSPGCFVLFPNPTSNELRLDLKEHIGSSAVVQIHDNTGKEVMQTRIMDISSESSRLDVASFPPGIYVATVQIEGKPPMSQCFVVNR